MKAQPASARPGPRVMSLPCRSALLNPQVIPYLLYADAGAAMDWLIKTFRLHRASARPAEQTAPSGHGELLLDNGGVIMLGSPGPDFPPDPREPRWG